MDDNAYSSILTPDKPEAMAWSLFGIWNKALERRNDRVIKPRERIWASELGGAYVDRYLKMLGVTPSTPPNDRTKRKWDMGIFFEDYLRSILRKADLLREYQDYLKFQYPDLLPVTGRLDFLAGGKPNFDNAKRYIEEWTELNWPEFKGQFGKEIEEQIPRWVEISYNFLEYIMEEYKDKELKTLILEIKTCSVQMFNTYEMTNKPNPHHVLQTFHYLKAKPLPEGHILYLCKDDGRAIEFGIVQPSPVEDFYKADIEQMTYYYNNKIQPDPEPLILFNPDKGIFQKNWKVEYSSYLFHLYGFETPLAYREAVDTKVRRFNGLLTRIAEEKPLTKMNIESSEVIKDYFPNFDELIIIAKDLKAKGKLVEEGSEAAQEKDESII